MSFLNRIIKKQDMISDSGVNQKGNHVDVAVISLCILIIGLLIYLGVMAYINA